MARVGACRICCKGSVRKGDGGARCRYELRRSGCAGAASSSKRTAHGRNVVAGAFVRQCGPVRGSAGRVVRHIDRPRDGLHPRKNISGFRALYRQAGLPDTAYPAFREALAAMRAGFLVGEQGGAARLKRRMVERVLGACAHERGEDAASLLALLRRFPVEAAREEARLFCDDLVAENPLLQADESYVEERLAAA